MAGSRSWSGPAPERGLPDGRLGDPGLFGPGSVVWRVARERVLLLGGPAALLMQVAHPLIAAAVLEHSDFLADPRGRLRRTLHSTLTITFGDREEAQRAAEAVGRVHGRVRGVVRGGGPPAALGARYAASDPVLAHWVHATLIFVAVRTYERFVARLPDADRARHYEEAKRFAEVFGVPRGVMPPDLPSFLADVDRTVSGPTLELGADARTLCRAILRPSLPAPFGVASGAMDAVTAGLLPQAVRERFGLGWGPGRRATLSAITPAVRLAVRASPPALRFWPQYRAAIRRMRAETPNSYREDGIFVA